MAIRAPLLIALLLLARPNRAQETGPRAQEVASAFDAGRSLEAFATARAADPWLVADALFSTGRDDVAIALARASPHPDVAALPAYLATRHGGPESQGVREWARTALRARTAAEMEDALQRFPGVEGKGDGFERCQALFARAVCLQGLRQWPDASAAYSAAAEIGGGLGWWRRAAEARHLAGTCALRAEDREAAARHWKTRLEIEDRRGDGRGRASTLLGLGNLHGESGEYAEALECYARSGRMLTAGEDDLLLLRVLGSTGRVHLRRGALREALTVLDAAVDLAEVQGQPELRAQLLLARSSAYERLGDYDFAEAAQNQALLLLEPLPNRAGLAEALGCLGHTQLARGEAAKAIENLERSRAIYAESGQVRGEVTALVNLSLARTRLGMHDAARTGFEAALVKLESLRDPWLEAGARLDFAELLRAAGDVEGARGQDAQGLRIAEGIASDALLVRARLGIAEDLWAAGDAPGTLASAREGIGRLGTLVGGLALEEGARARQQHARLFHLAAEAALGAGDADAYYEVLESGRAGALMEALAGHTDSRRLLLTERQVREEEHARAIAGSCEEAYRQALASGDRADIARRRDALDAARADLRRLCERGSRESGDASTLLYPRPAALQAVDASLRRADALVLYSVPPGGSASALVRTGGESRLVALGSSDRVLALLAGIDLSAGGSPDFAPLERALTTPLKLGPEVRRVLVSPDSEMSWLPWCCLLGEREVAYAPSGTAYALLRERAGMAGSGILAIADPLSAGDAFPRLPGSETEARAVADTILLGADATEEALYARLERETPWRAVHFACHGRVNTDRPMESALILAPGPKEEGLLRAMDILRRRMRTCLVVLSACDTARGKGFRGEGLVGLVPAFLLAGAPRVIAAAWKVDDAATRALMTAFYASWAKEGRSTAASLRRAQEVVRQQEKWRPPYYWAAWQLWGLPD